MNLIGFEFVRYGIYGIVCMYCICVESVNVLIGKQIIIRRSTDTISQILMNQVLVTTDKTFRIEVTSTFSELDLRAKV